MLQALTSAGIAGHAHGPGRGGREKLGAGRQHLRAPPADLLGERGGLGRGRVDPLADERGIGGTELVLDGDLDIALGAGTLEDGLENRETLR